MSDCQVGRSLLQKRFSSESPAFLQVQVNQDPWQFNNGFVFPFSSLSTTQPPHPRPVHPSPIHPIPDPSIPVLSIPVPSIPGPSTVTSDEQFASRSSLNRGGEERRGSRCQDLGSVRLRSREGNVFSSMTKQSDPDAMLPTPLSHSYSHSPRSLRKVFVLFLFFNQTTRLVQTCLSSTCQSAAITTAYPPTLQESGGARLQNSDTPGVQHTQKKKGEARRTHLGNLPDPSMHLPNRGLRQTKPNDWPGKTGAQLGFLSRQLTGHVAKFSMAFLGLRCLDPKQHFRERVANCRACF